MFHCKTTEQDFVALMPSDMADTEITLLSHSSTAEEPQEVECTFLLYISAFADSMDKHNGEGRDKKGE